MTGKRKKQIATSKLREDEMNSGVGKVLLDENTHLRKENEALKKSLNATQNKLEKMREKYHELDKANHLLNYKLHTSFWPEFFKFVASSVGAGFAVNFFFSNQTKWAMGSLLMSFLVYGGILFIYRKK